MAQFIAFDPKVEVNAETVLSIVDAMKGFETLAKQILSKNGIDDPKPGQWFKQQAWLDSFKEISAKLGASTLFNIGKAIPENAKFPPDIDSLQKGLSLIDVAYHMNHRNGEIGYYKLVSYDEQGKVATMECKNPYPSHFDKGIISTFARKFKPANAKNIIVELDSSKPSRLDNAESCWYIVSWS